jgi:putative ABC transport system permease protein
MWLNTLLLALRSIRRNLLRSFLTILGIVIGVSAVITMVTVGNGATLAVQNQISSLGTNLLQVRPGQRMGPGSGGASAPFFKDVRRRGDRAADRRRRGRGARGRAPAARWWPTAATGRAASSAAPTTGSDRQLDPGQGREFSRREQRAGSAVCMIGETVRASCSAAARLGERCA